MTTIPSPVPNHHEVRDSSGDCDLEVRAGTETAQSTTALAANAIMRMPRCGAADVLGYVLPELHTGKIWYIDYYVKSPVTGSLVCKRIKVNRLKNLTARRAYARQLIAELTRKLQVGWTPWIEGTAPNAHTTLAEALDQWDRTKSRQLRHSSPYSYTSMTSVFREWCRDQDVLLKYAHAFNRSHAIGFMDYISEVRMVGNRTYNNYRVYLTMLFSWMCERGFRTDDPFKGFKPRKQPKKTRSYLSEKERAEMVEWIEAHDPDFLLPVLWIYYTLIRPGELRRLRVNDVDIQRQVVHIPAEKSKSGDERHSTIPDVMLQYLHAAHLDNYPSRAWLITKSMVPGQEQIFRNCLNRRWTRMRLALGWDQSKQLYSLRDTGIIDLIRAGVDLLAVRDQAGHKDLATTNEYVKHAFPHGPVEIRAKAVPIRSALAPIRDETFSPGVINAAEQQVL